MWRPARPSGSSRGIVARWNWCGSKASGRCWGCAGWSAVRCRNGPRTALRTETSPTVRELMNVAERKNTRTTEREVYVDLFGPTTGDEIRLADTGLRIKVTDD